VSCGLYTGKQLKKARFLDFMGKLLSCEFVFPKQDMINNMKNTCVLFLLL